MTERSGSFDDAELETWSAFATVLEWLPAALDAQLQADSDLTHFEFGILYALSRADRETLRMSTLAGYANSTLSRLSRAVGRLEQRGWVRRSPDPDDGRYTLATLTPSGRRTTRGAEPGHVALVRALVLDPLSPTQARQLRTISRKVAAAIREQEGWTP